jgi:phage gp29-like protein
MANDLSPFQSAQPPALVDANGRPLRQAAQVMARELSAPTMAGVRSIYANHPAQGLDPLRLTQILRQAETGDATAYLELAEEMEEKDLHYLGILSTRKRQVSQLPITVEAVSDDPEDEADAKLVRDWTERPTLQLELFDILDAVGKGYSATEIIWDTSEAPWLPDQLKWRFPQFFEYDRVSGEQLLLKGGEDGVAGRPEPLRPYKYITHQVQAKSGLPIRGGLARIAAWGYLFKNFTIKDWMTFLEVYGLPLRVGKYQNGTSEDDIRKLAQAVAQIGSDAGAVIPASMMMEFVQSNGGTANPEMFRNMCQYLDDALSKAVLGQTSSADAKAGGLGSGQADLHSEVRKDIESADAAQLSATLMRDLVVPIVMFNRGRRKRYPRLIIGRPDPVDVEQALKAIGLALDFSIPVGMSYFRKVSGIPEPKPGEELLSKPAPQTPAAGPEGESGAMVPEKPPTSLLDPFKPASGGKRQREVAAAAQERKPDAIDTMVEEALTDWQGMVDPLLGSFDELIASATSMEEVRELLAMKAGDVIAAMDVTAIVQLGERVGFAGKIAGLVEKPGR